jgi:non-canonical purine NTP pyrophosphatase (RdgB/HAM1 family)
MKLIFVTGNKDKFDEASKIVTDLEQLDIDLTEIQSLDSKEIILHKLKEAETKVDGSIVVEDNSLSLECLSGLPGPLVKWFMKTLGNEGLAKIAKSFENTKAIASVIIGYKDGDTTEFFEGSIEGIITNPRGENGFGWDAIFQPVNKDKTFAEMTVEEKNEISMRKIAFRKLKDYLDKQN